MARRPVDIIIPVYKGFETTKACIESLLASENTLEAHVYVLNDASPDYEINAYLAWLSDNTPVTVLNNTCNLGFPRSVNKGFALNPDHDVILLNSDTLVFSNWADRMARAAYSSHDIGTVTPFSNNATICSYPFINKENPLPTDISPAELDDVFKQVNTGGICDLPTGVGFCMYLKRECLNDVGDFDEESFGRGYGEENDFCLRAHAQGWRNVLAADVYVPHLGGCSFGEIRNPLLGQNLAILNRRFEGYQESIKAFISDDLALGFRRAVDKQVLSMKAGRPLMLRICHGFGGGTAKRLRDEAGELLEQGYRVATIRPAKGERKGQVQLTFEDFPHCPNLTYDLPAELDAILRLLRGQNTREILLHHFLGLDPCVLNMPQMLGVPHTIIVHDYAWYCPRINLIDYTEMYCGEPDVEQCQRCSDINDNNSKNVYQLFKQSKVAFDNAKLIETPSTESATRIKKKFNIDNVKSIPHEKNIKVVKHELTKKIHKTINVAVIGGIGKHKGYDTLLNCAKDAASRNLPIIFTVVGETICDTRLFSTGKSMVTGKYTDDKVNEIISKNNFDIALFLSIWPETWCYTLTIAQTYDIPILATKIGSIPERILKMNKAQTIKITSPEHINNQIIACINQETLQPNYLWR